MNKKSLTEADVRTKFITPALLGADGEKWDLMTQVRGKTVKRSSKPSSRN